MKLSLQEWLFGAAALAISAGFSSGAWAGCGDGVAKRPVAFLPSDSGGGGLALAAFSLQPIVGMWSFNFTDSSGAAGDFGYVQWHADGTEIMNSGSRAPATENFCLGVWAQLGPRRFALNHWALSYDQTSGKLNAKVNIREDVTVDAGNNNYAGTYTMDVYDPQSGKKVAHGAGRVAAQRITL